MKRKEKQKKRDWDCHTGNPVIIIHRHRIKGKHYVRSVCCICVDIMCGRITLVANGNVNSGNDIKFQLDCLHPHCFCGTESFFL